MEPLGARAQAKRAPGQRPGCSRKALTVFFINIATVIGPTPPGNGRDLGGASGETDAKVDVPDQPVAGFLRGSRATRLIPTSITTDAGLHHVGRDEFGPADRGDQHVGLPGDRRPGSACLGMADGDGGVGAGLFLEREEGGGLSDDEGAAEDDDVLALQVDAARGRGAP